ncbi:aspartate/glutamate racemase family protein [Marinobacter caseinilyticus]|uniref:aspartate/glutamate racemase family protein n=1 Tax=Marinobacter caseinilyticus TaxID=2692195 RepID=UPI001408A683|nr:aspartate/glutamate racemase family protein [Marinobacter caseinilyticus]
MKTIGLLGGMSWESTASYYRIINEAVKANRGGFHSAPIAMVSVDFADIEALQRQGDWQRMAELLAGHARSVQQAGADLLLICTNTMHQVADQVQAAIEIPVVHIVDATAAALKQAGVTRVGLLGTRFTMEQPFFKDRLQQRYGIEVTVPAADDQKTVHEVIYSELCQGILRQESRQRIVSIIEGQRVQGAEAVILGCTEIALLVQPSDIDVPLYDTTRIHAHAAVAQALDVGGL